MERVLYSHTRLLLRTRSRCLNPDPSLQSIEPLIWISLGKNWRLKNMKPVPQFENLAASSESFIAEQRDVFIFVTRFGHLLTYAMKMIRIHSLVNCDRRLFTYNSFNLQLSSHITFNPHAGHWEVQVNGWNMERQGRKMKTGQEKTKLVK